jgi:hypothetical protein
MHQTCTNCHSEAHARLHCPTLNRKKKACYQCSQYNHLKADSPWNRKRHKQTDQQPKGTSSPSKSITVQPPLPQNPFLLPNTTDEPSGSDIEEDNDELMETMADDVPVSKTPLRPKVSKTRPNRTRLLLPKHNLTKIIEDQANTRPIFPNDMVFYSLPYQNCEFSFIDTVHSLNYFYFLYAFR